MSCPRRESHRTSRFVRAACIVASCAGLLLAGCESTGGSATQAGHYTVRVKTPIFRYGPAQNFGPDFSLPAGTHVILLRKEFGYSRVMTDDGQSGYVATEDLAPAPPPPVPPAAQVASTRAARGFFGRSAPLPTRGTARPGLSSANNQVLQSGGLFGGEILPPLPEGDPLQGSDRPGFRVNVPAPTAPETKPKGKPGFRVQVPATEER